MAVRAVVFDIGGVLELPVDTGLDGRWEERLGLEPGAFFRRLRRSGLGRDANLGRISEAEFARGLVRLYGQEHLAGLVIPHRTPLPGGSDRVAYGSLGTMIHMAR
jgi:hypothetical protein